VNKLKIAYLKTDDLIPYARNSRTHSDHQIAQLAGSIKEFGFRSPVLVDGEKGILAGHGRVLAALKLGLAEVPTIDGSDMTKAQQKAYIIADNKLALNAGWDDEMLRIEIDDLKNEGFDVDVLGFDPSELQNKDIDYSILDDEDLSAQIDEMAGGVRKALQIEFEPDHYEEAQELVKLWRDEGAYVGYMLMDHLRKEKAKL